MAPLILEGNTLGEKHRFYNKLVDEGYEPLNPDDGDDVQVLLKIDIASKKRDVNYIVEMLKSEDQLYVSKAIKRSTWLITDPQYAHIINPQHLYKHLRPQMTSKAFNKLMLSVRLQLKDHARVEEFYNYIIEENTQTAFKWLQHCSIDFVEKAVAKYGNDISDMLLKRLFEKSFTIFEEYTLKCSYRRTTRIVSEADYLAVQYPDKFLDFLISLKKGFYMQFSQRVTKALMKKCPQKIFDNFELFGEHLDMFTFAKYISKNGDIEEFLLKHANNENLKWLYSQDKLQHFIKNMQKDKRFEFVKKVFIDKDFFNDQKKNQTKRAKVFYQCAMKCSGYYNQSTNSYQWYKYAPFEIAFNELKKLIRAESSPATRNAMFQILVSCCGRNPQHFHTLLQYYLDKHINEPFKFKSQFVNYFISRVDTHSLDDDTWKLLNKLFHSMDVYIASENNVQSCIRSIIVRNLTRNEEIPETVKQKFVFDTLKNLQKKLILQKDKDAVFNFLYKETIKKYQKLDLLLKQDYNEAISLCERLLKLIKDWNRKVNSCPDAIQSIRKLIKANKENSWSSDLSQLYTLNKSWRREMFQESISLLANEEVCINALKHDPGLLSQNKTEVEAMCCNDTVTLKHFLSKIRVYWVGTLAEDWKKSYMQRLDKSNSHKAIISGLCALLSEKELKDLIKKYAPSEVKIDWDDTDQRILSIRKQLAKNIHKARPLVAIEELLPYAKGDYLQFAVPSVSAILSQLSSQKSQHIIPRLLDAPVSLKKFGIRHAFLKLDSEELKPMLNDIWDSTKNSSIRAILFIQTYTMLCKENNVIRIKKTWELLSAFIDKLTAEENKLIYEKLSNHTNVPDCVQAQFFMKSFVFLSSLPAKCNCDELVQRMTRRTADIMHSLDDDFVINVLMKNISDTITKEGNIYDKARLISSFILSSKDEYIQIRRYEKSLAPILIQVLPLWGNIFDGKYRIKENTKSILEKLFNDMDIYVFDKKMNVPVKVFEIILLELEKSFTYDNEYEFLTTWKLATKFVKILSKKRSVIFNVTPTEDNKEMPVNEKEELYNETHRQIAPLFAKACEQYLKEDSIRFGPSVYLLFNEAYNKLFREYMCGELCHIEQRLEYLKYFLKNHDQNEVWLLVSILLRREIDDIYADSTKQIFEYIREIVKERVPNDVKIHFVGLFSNMPPFVPPK